ncbi:ATP-binding protein [Dehalococcoides sp. THU3]|uniref:PAS domain-containing sensor histidine kinase n=1 Tax=Dehalococcoides TaxID=61434 RepID=UPI0032181183
MPKAISFAMALSLLDKTSDFVIFIDPGKDLITYANDTCCLILGYTRNELMALSFSSIGDLRALINLDAQSNPFNSMAHKHFVFKTNRGQYTEVIIKNIIKPVQASKTQKTIGIIASPILAGQLQNETEEGINLEDLKPLSVRFKHCQIYKMVFELTNDAILITSVKGPGLHDRIILEANPVFERRTGYKKSEIIGKDTTFLYPEGFKKNHAKYNRELWNKQNLVTEIQTRTKNRTNVYSELSSHLFRVNNEWMCVTIGRDITERKKAEKLRHGLFKKEHELRENLELAEKERIKFIRALIHELKTPLTPMLAMTEMLTNESTGILKQYAANLNVSTEFLLSRINDLYDLARSEVSILSIEKSWVNLGELLEEVRVLEENSCIAKDMTLSISISDPQMHCFIDENRIKQVIINLVNNAIKHNLPGCKIEITAKMKAEMLYISVIDNGIGISLENQAKLFLPHQVNKSGGLGLGLSLSAKLVELHGGHIKVKSELNKGSKFTISLPINNYHSPK